MSDDKFHRLLSRAAPSLLSPLEAHNREIELATARKVLAVIHDELCYDPTNETYKYLNHHSVHCQNLRTAILALYPELAQPVERRTDASDAVSGLHFARPSDFQQLHHNDPGKERSDG